MYKKPLIVFLILLSLGVTAETRKAPATNQPLLVATQQLARWFKYWTPTDAKAPLVTLIMQRQICGIADAETYLEMVATDLKSRQIVFQAFYDLTQGDRDYLFLNLKNLGLTAVNARVITDYIIDNESKYQKHSSSDSNLGSGITDEPLPNDYSQAVTYDNFTPQNDKIFWTVREGMRIKISVNKTYIKNAEPNIKAILAYYSSVCNTYAYISTLNIGEMCSREMFGYISKHFKNSTTILDQISQCSVRALGGEYLLNQLELTKSGNIITVSFSITNYEDNRSKNTFVGIDTFQINNDGTVTASKLSPKGVFKTD